MTDIASKADTLFNNHIKRLFTSLSLFLSTQLTVYVPSLVPSCENNTY